MKYSTDYLIKREQIKNLVKLSFEELQAKQDDPLCLAYYQAITTYLDTSAQSTTTSKNIYEYQQNALSWFYNYWKSIDIYDDNLGADFIKRITQRVNSIIGEKSNYLQTQNQRYSTAYNNIQSFESADRYAFAELLKIIRNQGNNNISRSVESYFYPSIINDQSKWNLIKETANLAYNLFPTNESTDLGLVVASRTPLWLEIQKCATYGATLSNNTSLDKLHMKQTQNIIDVLSYGPIKGLVNSFRSIALNDIALYDATGKKLLPNVKADERLGYPIQAPSHLSFFPSVTKNINQVVNLNSPVQVEVNFPNCDTMIVVLSCRGLSGADTQNPNATIKPTIHIKASNSGRRQLVVPPVTGHWQGEKELAYSVRLLRNESWPITVEVGRLDQQDPEGKIQNEFSLARITGVAEIIQNYPSLAYVSLSYDSDIFEREPNRSYLIDGRLVKVPSNYEPVNRYYYGDWDGTWKTEWTNNPVWIIYDLLTNRDIGIGQQLPEEKINKWSFYDVAKYCDEPVNGKPRWSCNVSIDKTVEAFKAIGELANNFRMQLVQDPIGLKLVIERPQEPVALFTNANILNGKFSYQGSNIRTRSKRIRVEFTDKDRDYSSQAIYITDNENVNRYQAEKTIKTTGCTDRDEAKRIGVLALATEKYETNIIKFGTSLVGCYVTSGDIISVSDYLVNGDYTSGRFGRVARIFTKGQLDYYRVLVPKNILGKFVNNVQPKQPLQEYSEDNKPFPLGLVLYSGDYYLDVEECLVQRITDDTNKGEQWQRFANYFLTKEDPNNLEDGELDHLTDLLPNDNSKFSGDVLYFKAPTSCRDQIEENATFTLYATGFEPKLYRVLTVEYDLSKNEVYITAQNFYKEKFDLAELSEEQINGRNLFEIEEFIPKIGLSPNGVPNLEDLRAEPWAVMENGEEATKIRVSCSTRTGLNETPAESIAVDLYCDDIGLVQDLSFKLQDSVPVNGVVENYYTLDADYNWLDLNKSAVTVRVYPKYNNNLNNNYIEISANLSRSLIHLSPPTIELLNTPVAKSGDEQNHFIDLATKGDELCFKVRLNPSGILSSSKTATITTKHTNKRHGQIVPKYFLDKYVVSLMKRNNEAEFREGYNDLMAMKFTNLPNSLAELCDIVYPDSRLEGDYFKLLPDEVAIFPKTSQDVLFPVTVKSLDSTSNLERVNGLHRFTFNIGVVCTQVKLWCSWHYANKVAKITLPNFLFADYDAYIVKGQPNILRVKVSHDPKYKFNTYGVNSNIIGFVRSVGVVVYNNSDSKKYIRRITKDVTKLLTTTGGGFSVDLELTNEELYNIANNSQGIKTAIWYSFAGTYWSTSEQNLRVGASSLAVQTNVSRETAEVSANITGSSTVADPNITEYKVNSLPASDSEYSFTYRIYKGRDQAGTIEDTALRSVVFNELKPGNYRLSVTARGEQSNRVLNYDGSFTIEEENSIDQANTSSDVVNKGRKVFTGEEIYKHIIYQATEDDQKQRGLIAELNADKNLVIYPSNENFSDYWASKSLDSTNSMVLERYSDYANTSQTDLYDREVNTIFRLPLEGISKGPYAFNVTVNYYMNNPSIDTTIYFRNIEDYIKCRVTNGDYSSPRGDYANLLADGERSLHYTAGVRNWSREKLDQPSGDHYLEFIFKTSMLLDSTYIEIKSIEVEFTPSVVDKTLEFTTNEEGYIKIDTLALPSNKYFLTYNVQSTEVVLNDISKLATIRYSETGTIPDQEDQGPILTPYVKDFEIRTFNRDGTPAPNVSGRLRIRGI